MQWIPKGKTFETEDEKIDYLYEKINKYLKQHLPQYYCDINYMSAYKIVISLDPHFQIYRDKIQMGNITMKSDKDWEAFFNLKQEYKNFYNQVKEVKTWLLGEIKKKKLPIDKSYARCFFERFYGTAAGKGEHSKVHGRSIWDEFDVWYDLTGFHINKQGKVLYYNYDITPKVVDTLKEVATALRRPTKEEENYEKCFND